jgi:hypothetical protein
MLWFIKSITGQRAKEGAPASKVERIISKFGGFPATRILKNADDRIGGVQVTPVVLTPGRAKLADFLGTTSAVGLTTVGLGIVAGVHDPALYWW